MPRKTQIPSKGSSSVRSMSDHELRSVLKDHGVSPGPITDSTRELYRKKLESILDNIAGENQAADENEDSDEETSDESFRVDEEELNESSDSFSEEVDEQDDEEEDEEDREDGEDDEDESNGENNEEPVRKKQSYYKLYIALLISLLASIYLYSNDIKAYRNLTKQLIIVTSLSPIGYIIYRTYRFYVTRRNEENRRVCELVSEALELLQSPENPSGLMPILHIRDTLLTPAERKAKKTIRFWENAVKFIENHESRVKVELVNIDGEDFRAWKWIGSRKLREADSKACLF